ncbi:MAG: hypothetical protein ACP5XB_01705 [Isosphaeraceae bacterium]
MAALFFWERGGRRLLCWLFAPAVVIGPIGWYVHNDGKPLERLRKELAVWKHPFGNLSNFIY